MIRVIVADDHHLVRQGIRALLEKQAHIQVIGEAQDGQQAVDLTHSLKPDVLLLDINMPRINGIEVVRRVREAGSQTEILILSMYEDESLVIKALRNGARGFILKKSVTEELFTAIAAASARKTYLSPEIFDVMENGAVQPGTDANPNDDFERLTSREREVCQLIAEGNTNNEVAHQLGISIKTVEKHRANLMEKLGVQDIAGLVREAIKNGIVFIER
jgi:DNA-binding NarL/FixJ family response regulator